MNKNKLKKLEEKIDVKSKKNFCVFQEEKDGIIRYENKEYKNLEVFKIENGVSDSDEILIISFIG